MYRILFKIGSVKIYSFDIMLLLGFIVAGFVNCRYLVRIRCLSSDERLNNLPTVKQLATLYFYFWVWGIVGSWLTGVIWKISTDGYYRSHIDRVSDLFSVSLVSYGGIIGIFLAGFWYFRKVKLPILRSWDLVAVYLPLIRVFHRIGCFLNGCCRGKPTKAAIGVYYPTDNAVAYHPFPLYMAVFLMVIFLILRYMRKRTYPDGFLWSVGFMLYFPGRFFIEFFRNEESIVRGIPITMAQLVCIIGSLVFLTVFLRLRKYYSKL